MRADWFLSGFGTFLPIIIREGFHYSLVQAQYLVIPVNIWGAVVYAVGAVLVSAILLLLQLPFCLVPRVPKCTL